MQRDTSSPQLQLVASNEMLPPSSTGQGIVVTRETVRTEIAKVEEVFTFWRELLSTPRSRLDADREKKIRAMLKIGYSVEDLKLAVIGCAFSDFHAGANDRHTRYQDIELICRHAKNVDRFIAIAEREGERLMRERRERAQQADEKAKDAAGERSRSAETEAMFQAMLAKLKARRT